MRRSVSLFLVMSAWCVALSSCSESRTQSANSDGGAVTALSSATGEPETPADDGGQAKADSFPADTVGSRDRDASSGADAPPSGVDASTDDAKDVGTDAARSVVDTSDLDARTSVNVDSASQPQIDAGPLSIGEICFAEIYDPEDPTGPQYDPFEPVVAEHCWGTNHQDISGVEQVVFLGDSVTVGTPNLAHLLPTDNSHFYRNLLADFLAEHFDLDTGGVFEWGIWRTWDALQQKGGSVESGDFKNCSNWGARTDDFIEGKNQFADCFPTGGSDKKTLVVFTMGGNDLAKINQKGSEASEDEVAAGYPSVWAIAQSTVSYLEEAIVWLKDPERFPNGSYVIFANPFEFTDGTGDIGACAVAELAGYGDWVEPAIQEEMVIWVLEQYMQIAVDTETDLLWLLEHFCGHGYVATGPDADPENGCYRGPDAELYFDETCVHPSPAGHNAIFEMFKATVLE